jgi:uncharacterized protein with FMN-binding domain
MTGWQTIAARRNATVLGATAAVVGLLFLYPTSTNHGGGQHRPGQAVAPPGVVLPKSSPGSGTAGSTGPATKVINGTSADTRYGPVQVQLHVRGRRIVSAKAIDYPRGSGRDRQINSYAIPVLQREAVAAQSAQIDTVSGATFTSDGYRTSLQSALDAAHL